MSKLKVDVVQVFNQVINYINKQIENDEEVPKELQVIDVKFQLIAARLHEVGQYAESKEDQGLIHLLSLIGVFKEEGEENGNTNESKENNEEGSSSSDPDTGTKDGTEA